MIAGQKSDGTRYQSPKDTTLGVIFLGVPHDGSELTLFGKLVSYGTYWLGSRTELLSALEPGAEALRELNDVFLKGYGSDRYHMANFFETRKSRICGIPLKLVSVILGITDVSGYC